MRALIAGTALAAALVTWWRSDWPLAQPKFRNYTDARLASPADRGGNGRRGESFVQASSSTSSLAELWNAALKETDATRRLEALLSVARRVPLSAIRELLQRASLLEDPEFPFEVRRAALRRWAQVDGRGAADWLGELPPAEQSPLLVGAIVANWAEADLPAAAAWFAHGVAAEWREPAVLALSGALSSQPLDKVVGLVRGLPDAAARESISAAVLEQWKHRDPAAAASLALTEVTSSAQSNLLGRVIPDWAQSDLPAARQWVREMPAGPLQTAALIHLSNVWLAVDPAGAATFAAALAPGNEQVLSTLTSQWAQRDPRAVVDWSRQLPEGAAKNAVFHSLTTSWAQTDPPAAAAFALGLPTGMLQQDIVISAVSVWANHAPQTAADWAANLPAGPLRDYAIENVFYSWTGRDPITAVAWLSALPVGPSRDAALNAGAGRLVETFPDLAAGFAAGISNETMRNRQIERAARAWMTVDRDVARQWIEHSNLPMALKRNLLDNAPPHRWPRAPN